MPPFDSNDFLKCVQELLVTFISVQVIFFFYMWGNFEYKSKIITENISFFGSFIGFIICSRDSQWMFGISFKSWEFIFSIFWKTN